MVLQNTGTAEHRYWRAWYCRIQVLQSIGTAEHKYSRAQVQQNPGTAEHRYSRAQVPLNTGTVEPRSYRAWYWRTQVQQSTIMQSAAAYFIGVEQNCANDNLKLYWRWSVAWNLVSLLISSTWNAWHYTHSSDHLNCFRFRHKQTDQQANPNVWRHYGTTSQLFSFCKEILWYPF
jgi:hypothetical protein